jgi:hemerythrin-like domain-containing protein
VLGRPLESKKVPMSDVLATTGIPAPRATGRSAAPAAPAAPAGALTGPRPGSTLPTDVHEVMNQIVHAALRRDLRRTEEVLRGPISARRRTAMVAQLRFLLHELHRHHTAEDEIIWPAVLVDHPDLAELSSTMEAEHHRLDWAIERLGAALDTWLASGDPADRGTVRRAAHDLSVVLEPHLRHEEEVAMPMVAQRLTARQWKRIDKKLHAMGSPSAMARQLFWLLDDLDEPRRDVLLAVLPGPVLRVLSALYGRRERRRVQLVWG